MARNSRSRKRYQRGGAGAAEWGLQTYGDMSQQHAIPGGNQIAAMSHSGGGRRYSSRNNMSIPSIYLVANTSCRKNRKRKGKGRKSGRMKSGRRK